jgi:hypothetical protein
MSKHIVKVLTTQILTIEVDAETWEDAAELVHQGEYTDEQIVDTDHEGSEVLPEEFQ